MPDLAVYRSDIGFSLRRGLLCLLLAMLAGGALLLAILIDGGAAPVWGFVLFTAACWVWLLAGIIAWWRRPSNRLGALLVLGSAALTLGEANSSAIPGLASIGQVFATAILAVTVHLLLAFPSGRIRGRSAAAIVVGGYAVAIVGQIPLYAFDADFSTLPVFIADRPDLRTLGSTVQEVAGTVVMLATTVVLLARLRNAQPYQRRVLVPLFGYGIFAVLFIPLSSSVLGRLLGADPVVVAICQIVVIALVPIAFASAVLRGGFARTGEVMELASWLATPREDRADLSAALASVLGDPSLQVVFWVAERARYVDSDGHEVVLPDESSGRSAVEIELSGEQIGALVYDSDLIAEPEIVRTAGRVVALGVDRERLTAALRLTEQSLRRSRERIVETADRERRRIATDLHDGLQVQLVLLALEAQQLANEASVPAAIRSRATELRRGIDAAAADLRTLVHEVMPSSLLERGLAMATEDLVDRLPLRTSLHIGDIGSLPESVASTAYFVVAEAVSNVVKHAHASKVSVRLDGAVDRLDIEIVDDGVGGAAVDHGTGLRGLQDRADVLGGRLQLTSAPGRGTTLSVRLPVSTMTEVAEQPAQLAT